MPKYLVTFTAKNKIEVEAANCEEAKMTVEGLGEIESGDYKVVGVDVELIEGKEGEED